MIALDAELKISAENTLAALRERLASELGCDGHWHGRLSSSALATAVTCFALARADRASSPHLIRRGFEWMAAHQNEDGGWGDSPESPSNLTATLLGWAALNVRDPAWSHLDAAEQRAARWLSDRMGDLSASGLAQGIRRRYRADRTFAGPILALCALSGRLGDGAAAWRHVPQLPFEMAIAPAALYRRLRLTVVSYALPALIAVGLVRHRMRPSLFPPLRILRDRLAPRLVALARRMQPVNGGYEEATPLTAFVVMCLNAAGYADDETVTRGVRFLRAAVRENGSWPIDSDLATWVTTLSVRALAHCPGGLDGVPLPRVRRWLLDQQSRAVHPLTLGAPGGWAWTDLPGGMPDADDTAGALLALRQLPPPDEQACAAATAGIRWLLALQNSDGGIPTFSKGWGRLPFDRSCPDISAHALQSLVAWQHDVPRALQDRLPGAITRIVRYLARTQRDDGAWVPLWFGNQAAPREENPVYGTARTLAALRLAAGHGVAIPGQLLERATRCLLTEQNRDGGWGAAKGAPSSVEETGLALSALAGHAPATAVAGGVAWLVRETAVGTRAPATPIGLYFARLWYSERLYPLIFAIEGLARTRYTETA